MTDPDATPTATAPDGDANRAAMLARIDALRALEARAATLSEARRPRFEARGQLTPRDRLAHLLDPGLPWLPLYGLAGYRVDDPDPDSSVPGASMIAGIGFVSGVRCLVLVDDSGINAGAMTMSSVRKALGCLRIAERQKLPFVHLVESAGANLLDYEVEMWAHGGGMFHGLARLSAAGLPVITVLHGPSTAGGAYQPGLSDYVIGVRRNGMAALAGAALVRAATGEISRDSDLGGAEMHARQTGLVEYLAEDDAHGIALARDVVARLDWNRDLQTPPRDIAAPDLPADSLLDLIPPSFATPYDAHDLLTRLVDGSDLLAFKPDYGPGTVCVQARVMGHAVGVLANNGPIDPAGATKAAQFIQLCDQAGHPIVFLSNTTGFIVGEASESAGMIKHGAKMIQAVSNARVPKITFYVGASFGAGNYAMCGMAYEPDFLFAWPNAETGVMGGRQAAMTMQEVARSGAARRGKPVDEAALDQQGRAIAAHFDAQADAFYTSGRLLDMGVIDPRDTRAVLGFALDTVREAARRVVRPNSYGVARM